MSPFHLDFQIFFSLENALLSTKYAKILYKVFIQIFKDKLQVILKNGR